jgi:hypothetical protein
MGMYFGGAHFDYDDYQLKDNTVIAAHFIHSVVRMTFNQGKINYNKGMSVDGLYLSNKSFFDKVQQRYKKERNYDIEVPAIKTGIKWFLEGVGVE